MNPAQSNPDWLEVSRTIAQRLDLLFRAHPKTQDRATSIGRGKGGDTTLLIDQLAEDEIFSVLAETHDEGHDFRVLSEERGRVNFGTGGPLLVIDPVDGSLNAKRTIPNFSLSIAVARGSTMSDVEFGYVYDFGPGEEYHASSGKGAWLDGRRLAAETPRFGLEVVGFESAEPGLVGPAAQALAGQCRRLRIVGSIAVALCYVAASRIDALVTLKACRSFDAAAGQLIAREAGAAVLFTAIPDGLSAPLDLDPHSPCVSARDPEHLTALQSSQAAADDA